MIQLSAAIFSPLIPDNLLQRNYTLHYCPVRVRVQVQRNAMRPNSSKGNRVQQS